MDKATAYEITGVNPHEKVIAAVREWLTIQEGYGDSVRIEDVRRVLGMMETIWLP